MRVWGLLAISLVFGQGMLWVGLGFSPQQGLTGRDTVFRLSGPSQFLWMEYRSRSRLPWDSLWVILRTPSKIEGTFVLVRTKDPLTYRGRVRVRTASIFLALVIPPRQYRQILRQSRFYVTDAKYPTVASLRKAAAGQQAAPTLSIEEVPIESLSLPEEALEIIEVPKVDEAIEDPIEDIEDLDSLGEPDALDAEPEEELDFEDLEDL